MVAKLLKERAIYRDDDGYDFVVAMVEDWVIADVGCGPDDGKIVIANEFAVKKVMAEEGTKPWQKWAEQSTS